MNKRRSKKRRINKRKLAIIVFIILMILCLIKSINKKEKNDNIKQKNIVDSNEITTDDITEVTEKSVFPTDVFGVPVYTELIKSNTNARPGIKRKIKYIVIHETDNFEEGTGAKNHAEFLSENNIDSTSWHYTVDDTEIYHHIPDNEIAFHAATKTGNLYGIGIELCVNSDGDFEKTFNNATKLVAYLLKEYNLTIYDIKTHHDFSGKDCPHSILKNNRMDEFIEKVQNLINKM